MALTIVPETYSQTATVPVRNFGGYTAINYLMQGSCTINSGTTITIPEGITFKSTSYLWSSGQGIIAPSGNIANGFIVNGRLNIQGSSAKPVVFTNDKDDRYGSPADMNQNGTASLPPEGTYSGWSGNWIEFNDVSDDLSTVSNAVFNYGEKGISTLSASPSINSVRFEKLIYGVDMNGVSTPVINNCTFHNLQYFPIQISLIAYPASTTGNIISGTTYKIIAIRDETLTQDVTLVQRNFGGINNIPYYWINYTIGTSATLTINPGVVCKFAGDYWYKPHLTVFKGLIANGGSTPDSKIIFTSIRDDFYGGDSNSDNARTFAERGDWGGLNFEDQSLDPLCQLKNCVIRFADKGIQTVSASPTIENCNINNNNYGVFATAASNPTFSNCDFMLNYFYALNNVDKSFIIDAPNCWWGSNFGPIQTDIEGDGSSLQELVSDAINFTPWKSTGAINPIMGDVSLNGAVQAYDASLILKYVVNPFGADSLAAPQRKVADVSGNGGVPTDAITAYDASLVLQYVVSLIDCFPANVNKSSGEAALARLALQKSVAVNVEIGAITAAQDNRLVIPINIHDAVNLMAFQATMAFDPAVLTVEKIEAGEAYSTAAWSSFINDEGEIRFALASEQQLASSGIIANITVLISEDVKDDIHVLLRPIRFLANEEDITAMVLSVENTFTCKPTKYELAPNYPNPFNPSTTIAYQIPQDGNQVRLTIYNTLGQAIRTLVNTKQNTGNYQTVWDGKNNAGIDVPSGMYIYQLSSGDFVKARKLMLIR